MPPFVCFFHFFRSGDSLAAASDPLWFFHENFDPPASPKIHAHDDATPECDALTLSHVHGATLSACSVVVEKVLLLASPALCTRTQQGRKQQQQQQQRRRRRWKDGRKIRYPKAFSSLSSRLFALFFFSLLNFFAALENKISKATQSYFFSASDNPLFFLQFNYLRLSTQNNEKALHRGSQEAKGKLFIFPMLPIFPPLPTAVRETFGRLHASSPNFHTSQYNPLPGAQYSDSLFTHWKRQFSPKNHC